MARPEPVSTRWRGKELVAKIYPVIMCGGSGTRLWPLSRRDLPKQFAVIRNGKSLFARAYERARGLATAACVISIGHRDYRFLMEDATGNERGLKNVFILEPAPRNTAAAIASAALYVSQSDPEAILACMPADHEIGSIEGFQASIAEAASVAAKGFIAILGVLPSHAATSYGYIKPGEPLSGKARAVEQFLEKPNEAAALDYCRKGYRWNSGLVVARADVLIEALSRLAPDVMSACREALGAATGDFGHVWLEREAFLSGPTISFDYAVLERHDRLAVIDFDAEWNDVGNWTELAKLYPRVAGSNHALGQVELRSCEGTFVHSPKRLTVALGVRDLIIVDTDDALLVAHSSKLEELRDVVSSLTSANRQEVVSHRKVARPWGWFESLDRGENYQVKRITVKPKGVLSLQYHHHRAEHWVVVKGTAWVTCGERQFALKPNESTYIPQGAVHRLENRDSEALELIEVQSGSYLGEDDIVRLTDSYGRAGEPKRDETAS
jgi:mannose-1-phosphate guanylyltransferase/mannose-6-phosphate isomerase